MAGGQEQSYGVLNELTEGLTYKVSCTAGTTNFLIYAFDYNSGNDKSNDHSVPLDCVTTTYKSPEGKSSQSITFLCPTGATKCGGTISFSRSSGVLTMSLNLAAFVLAMLAISTW